MIDSLLALYTKLKGGKCLIYIGREGSMKTDSSPSSDTPPLGAGSFIASYGSLEEMRRPDVDRRFIKILGFWLVR